MAIDHSALSSLSTSLDDLTRRIGKLAAQADADEPGAVDLLEVERQLLTANRRLRKLVRQRRT